MQYMRCKCGECQYWGSGMMPAKCNWCEKCETTLAGGPNGHKTERTPHFLVETPVETDDGHGILSRCKYCLQTKKQIIESGEPYETESRNS